MTQYVIALHHLPPATSRATSRAASKLSRAQLSERERLGSMHGIPSLVAAVFLVLGSLASLLLGHEAALRPAAPTTANGVGASYSAPLSLDSAIRVEGAIETAGKMP